MNSLCLSTPRSHLRSVLTSTSQLCLAALCIGLSAVRAHNDPPTSSGPIALTDDDRFVWVVNPDNNSVSVIEVGGDANTKIAEIPVGEDPTSVAIGSKGKV